MNHLPWTRSTQVRTLSEIRVLLGSVALFLPLVIPVTESTLNSERYFVPTATWFAVLPVSPAIGPDLWVFLYFPSVSLRDPPPSPLWAAPVWESWPVPHSSDGRMWGGRGSRDCCLEYCRPAQRGNGPIADRSSDR